MLDNCRWVMPGAMTVFDSNTLNASLRRKHSSDDNMIPLINIVFLLLIFFMVASHIDAFRPADVVLPEMDASEKATVEELSIVLVSSGEIFIDEQSIDLHQLNAWVEALGPSLTDTKITLQADKQVTAAALSPVLVVLRDHQISNITLYVQRKVLEVL